MATNIDVNEKVWYIMKKLKGFLQSGILFIGDPAYMAGPTDFQTVTGKLSGRELTPGVAVDMTPVDPYNPFRRWDDFQSKVTTEDFSLPFPGGSDGTDGRGVAVLTGRQDGQYELTKIVDEATGKVLEIRIVFKD